MPMTDRRKPDRKAKAPATLPVYHRSKRFDPIEHGGVKKLSWLFLLGGVILPLAAMVYETNTHYCARHFFDPFPSTGHILLFSLIPLSNFLSWLSTRRDVSNHYAAMALISGMALGVGCLYALMFLPITGSACMAIVFFGFGLLGLAPLLSLPCSWLAGKTVCKLAGKKVTYFNPHQVEHIGHMIILVMVLAIELPSTLTRINLAHATRHDAKAAEAVAWLRKYGSQEVLQRACYEHSGRATDILGSIYEGAHPIPVDEARRVFFRVTGKPFNTVSVPAGARATIKNAAAISDPYGLNAGVSDEFDFDSDIAGEVVSGMARGLSVGQSKIDGTVDADTALATLDWQFTFENKSALDREARLKLMLPPQAVIIHTVVTVDGHDYAAEILPRNEARSTYQSNVASRKNPFLLSMCGTDMAMMQCYPIKPGAEHAMKVHLQLAVPLTLREDNKTAIQMPTIVERNFEFNAPTGITLRSTGNLSSPALAATSANTFNAVVAAEQFANGIVDVLAERRPVPAGVVQMTYCKLDGYVNNSDVDRFLQAPRYSGLHKLIVVVDSSAAMKEHMPAIIKGLKNLPAGLEAEIKIVSDSDFDLFEGFKSANVSDYLAAVESLKTLKFEGGQDDYIALREALGRAANGRNVAVLWLHGAQPLSTGNAEELKPLIVKGFRQPVLFDMPLVPGPNILLQNIYAPMSLVKVPRFSTVDEDLSTFLQSCRPVSTERQKDAAGEEATAQATAQAVAESLGLDYRPGPTFTEWETHPRAGDLAVPGTIPATLGKPVTYDVKEVDARLLQIWANREIQLAEVAPDADSIGRSAITAAAFQIVSPASSAIIREMNPPTSTLAAAPPVVVQAKSLPFDSLSKFDADAAMDKSKQICGDTFSSIGEAIQSAPRSANLFNGPGGPELKTKGAELVGRPVDKEESAAAPAPIYPNNSGQNNFNAYKNSVNTAGTVSHGCYGRGYLDLTPLVIGLVFFLILGVFAGIRRFTKKRRY